MESQNVGPHQGEEEDHQEKSVYQKVKEKAKKMKNKFTKRGHGHEQDHHDPDEEDDAKEEEEDLEVPGATTTGSRATGQGDILKVPMAEFGDTKAAATHDHDPKVPHLEKTDPMKDCVPAASERTRQIHSVQPGVTPMHDEVLEPRPNYHASTTESLVGHDQIPSQQPKVDIGKTSVMGDAPHAPQNTPLPSLGEYKSKGADPGQAFISGKEEHLGQSREHTPVSSSDLGEHGTNAADPSPTFLSSSEGHLGQSGVHTPVSSLGGDDQKSNVADTRQTSVNGKEGHSGQTGVHRGLDDRTPISSRGDYQKTNVTDPSHTSATGNEGHFGQSEVNLDRPRGLEEDPNAHMADLRAFTPSNDQTKVTDPTNAGKEGHSGQTGVHRGLDDRTPISSRGDYQKTNVTDPSHTFATGKEGHFGQSEVNLDRPRGLEENTQAFTPPNYQTKVTGPIDAGGEEIGITPIVRSFDKMNIHAGDTKPSNQGSSYTEKVSSAASAIPDKATSAKNGVASTLGYGGGNNDQHEDVNPHADTRQTSVTGKEGHSGQTGVHRGLDDRTFISSRGDYQKTNVTDPSHTSATGNEGHFGQSEVNLDQPRGLEEDPNAHMAEPQAFTASNDQTKVTDPTNAGGDEVGITPIVRSFDKMNTHPGDTKPSKQGSSYTEKVSSAASAIPDKATSAKNGVASTLGYGGGNNDQHEDVNPHADSPENDSTKSGLHHDGTNQNLGTGSHDQFSPEHPPNQGGSYTEKISSTTSANADKAISAKNAIASKLGYGGGNNDQHEFVKPQDSSYQTTGTGQNLSSPENPSNQGKNVDTAISAKNVVASKVGYGGDTDQQQHGDHAAVGSGSAAPEQQGEGITAAVTEKPTTVYEKVAGAGSTLMSKLPGSTGTVGKEEVHQGPAATRGEYDEAGKDQGVSEKLKPDEEDRALSEVISETLQEHKAEQPRSDARPVGKVTESAEVTKQLGPDYGAEDVQQSGYGKVVADTIRGAFGSVFGKADQTTASPESLGSTTGTEGLSSSGTGVVERRGRGDESGK